MKALEMAYGLALLVTVILVCCISYGCYRFVNLTISSIPYEALLLLGLTCCASAGAVVSGGALFVLRWLSARSRQIYAKNGLYPHVCDGMGGYVNLNEAGAQSIAALSACRPSAGTVGKIAETCRQIGSYDPALIPGPAAPAMLTVEEVVSFDPRQTPHVLCIGSTGSGKTSATYQILSAMMNRHRCEFIVCELGGVNWGIQAMATKIEDIAKVIINADEEMGRRQELLRLHDVDHVSALPQPLPYKVIVLEEMDAVFDRLKLTNQAMRREVLVALRNIARMGRKAGICLVAVSQSGTTDAFDAQCRKNFGNVFLFHSEHTVSNAWQVGERLNNLPAGMAYSVAHGGFVQFGLSPRPQLVRNDSCAAEESGNAVAPVDPVVPVVAQPEVSLPRLSRGCEPDEQLAEQLRQLHQSGVSKTKLCKAVWGYKDDVALGVLNGVLVGGAQ